MSKKQRQTLRRIFAVPTPANIPWRDIEQLLRALGAAVEGGPGSRVVVKLADRRLVVHRPHPGPDTKRGAVRAVRRFLKEIGQEP